MRGKYDNNLLTDYVIVMEKILRHTIDGNLGIQFFYSLSLLHYLVFIMSDE